MVCRDVVRLGACFTLSPSSRAALVCTASHRAHRGGLVAGRSRGHCILQTRDGESSLGPSEQEADPLCARPTQAFQALRAPGQDQGPVGSAGVSWCFGLTPKTFLLFWPQIPPPSLPLVLYPSGGGSDLPRLRLAVPSSPWGFSRRAWPPQHRAPGQRGTSSWMRRSSCSDDRGQVGKRGASGGPSQASAAVVFGSSGPGLPPRITQPRALSSLP